ncbi:MAG: mannose-1-phosphate guanylyltransferase/mannose-6-phosphate isomerase [bacterium]|jgi:mannose-1-phosphate guanylyltransferase/mannose-6-phosphate isomerase
MIALILAGGSGSRLWPYSRTMVPKQFLNLGSTTESLLQGTYQRLTSLISPNDIYFIGSENHELELKKQVLELNSQFNVENILLEPVARNTAPAILWGISQIPESRKNEPVVILPADHLIQNQKAFLHYLEDGAKIAESGKLVTFGIRPDRPETGYGYIKAGNALDSVGFEVERFVEKPNLETAQEYIQDQSYTWNSGIFMGTANTFLEEFQKYSPEIYNAFGLDNKNAPEKQDIQAIFENVISDSIDYAIMEKSKKVTVLPVDMDWSDLGSWESIYQISPKDDQGNVTRGDVILQDTKNSLIFSNKKLIASIGLENIIIIDTEDAILACDLRRSQDVKTLVDRLKKEGRGEYEFHSKVSRPWGNYTILFEAPEFKIKEIEVTPGKRLSLQRHRHRAEHWIVIEGTADVVCDDKLILLTENESTFIPKTSTHRLGNSGKIPVRIIEVQQGSYLEEDDIERLEDDFGRF